MRRDCYLGGRGIGKKGWKNRIGFVYPNVDPLVRIETESRKIRSQATGWGAPSNSCSGLKV